MPNQMNSHLLIVTQRIDKNDENLGAFYYWFERFAREFDRITIIASSKGVVDLPDNVTVLSMGKDDGKGKLRRIQRFLQLFSRNYAKADCVFFHQIPEFVLAAAPFLISMPRTSVLWYAHKSVTRNLRMAEKLVDYIASSSPEGFRLRSKKVIYTGQAINTDLFKPKPASSRHASGLKLVTVGRISMVKNYEAIINACAKGKGKWPEPWTFTIVGGPIMPKDHDYLALLKRRVAELKLDSRIYFSGPATYEDIPALLQEHDLFLNVSKTGSLDKAVFEAMACGLSVLTSNEAYRSIVPAANYLEHTGPDVIAQRVLMLAHEHRPNMALRRIVEEHHSLEKTVGKITDMLKSHI